MSKANVARASEGSGQEAELADISGLKNQPKKIDVYLDEEVRTFIGSFQSITSKPCGLNRDERYKVAEIIDEMKLNDLDTKSSAELVFRRIKNIRFGQDNPVTPGINWLLKENNFFRVLNGEFKQQGDKNNATTKDWTKTNPLARCAINAPPA